MDDELRQRIEKLATVVCTNIECGGTGRMDVGPEDWGPIDCLRCHGIGKKWYPLDPLDLQYDSGAEIIVAVEQCLSIAGSWDYTYFHGASEPHQYDILAHGLIFDGVDRLTAALECLEAINEH